MRKFTLSLTLAVGIALVGCATLAPLPPSSETVSPQLQQGDLVLRLQVGDSRALQASDPVLVYDVSDVAKLVITPYLKEGDAFVPMSATGKPTTEDAADRFKFEAIDNQQRTFVFKNLPHDQIYRFVAEAYDAQNALISKDANNFTDVEFTRVEVADTPTLKLKLKDKPFVGTARTFVRFAGTPKSPKDVRLTLSKAGQTVGTLTVDKAQLPRNVVLGGLAPQTTYTLLAEAMDGAGQLLATASVPVSSTNQPTFDTPELSVIVRAKVETYAGSTAGNTGTTLANATFYYPYGVARHGGKLYVAELFTAQIRAIDPVSEAVSVFESGTISITDLAVHTDGTIYYVNGTTRNQVWRIKTEGGVPTKTLFAGSPSYQTGDADGTGDAARFNGPTGIVVDSQGNVFIADSRNNLIRKITPEGVVSTFAGSTQGYQDGTGSAAQFYWPYKLAIDTQDNLYVAESANRRIRKITPGGVVSTLAGSGGFGLDSGEALASQAKFQEPLSIAVIPDGSSVFVMDLHAVRQIVDGRVVTLAGSGTSGTADGVGAAAAFNIPRGLTILPDGNLMVADSQNHRLRKVILR